MLDFRQSAKPTVYHTSGPARRRVFYVVATIGLIYLIGFKIVPFVMSPLHDGAVETPIDTLLPRQAAAEKLDGQFVAAAPADAKPAAAKAKLLDGVRDDLLRDVRDDDLFRSREHDAFFHLLELADKTPDATLRDASLGRIAYAQLHQQAPQYRGQVVTIHGVLRQLQRLPAGRNKYGIEHYYQATIQPEDNPIYPIIVYLLDLPPGFPSQLSGDSTAPEERRDEVEVTGFFYRRLAYRALDDVRVAPLILARSFQWIVRDSAAQAQNTGQLSIVAALVTLTLVGLILLTTRGRGRIAGQVAPPHPEQLRTLENVLILPATIEGLDALAARMRDEPAIGPPPYHQDEGPTGSSSAGGRA